jgi:hypothetical protein
VAEGEKQRAKQWELDEKISKKLDQIINRVAEDSEEGLERPAKSNYLTK